MRPLSPAQIIMNRQTSIHLNNSFRGQAHRRQHGVILVITLVALVVLMIASTALMRTVDTATLISGNLAFKQSATASGDTGVQNAIAALQTLQIANNLNGDLPGSGYYATVTAPTGWLNKGGNLWATPVGGADAAGNQTRFVIQRMSSALGPCTPLICLYNTTFADNGSKVPKDLPTLLLGSTNLVLYRITVETQGPKGTTSYVQVFAN